MAARSRARQPVLVSDAPSERTRVRRIADKAAYDRPTIDAILDAGMIAHLAIVDDQGQPFSVPCAYARIGDEVAFHGSVASRLLRSSATGPMCLTVTLLDGLVVARSLFESSMHYRSVMVVGSARRIVDPVEQSEALLALSERLIPGRVAEARGPSEVELRQTSVMALRLDEASAKVSDAWPDDGPDDVALPIWAGVVPLRQSWGTPAPAPDLPPGIGVPASVSSLADDHRLVRPQGPTTGSVE